MTRTTRTVTLTGLLALVGATMFGSALPAHAQVPRVYQERTLQERKVFLELNARTARCMREGSIAMLRHGARDEATIFQFVMPTCARPMQEFLTNTGGWSADEANLFVAALAIEMLDKVLSQGAR